MTLSSKPSRNSRPWSSDGPYLGLTSYALLATMLEAFSDGCVRYHNVPLVYQRTQSQAEKLAEPIGRREESHMASGEEKWATDFGPSLGAYLQPLIERSAMTYEDIARLPEHLFTKKSLWEWVEENAALAEEAGNPFPDDVVQRSPGAPFRHSGSREGR